MLAAAPTSPILQKFVQIPGIIIINIINIMIIMIIMIIIITTIISTAMNQLLRKNAGALQGLVIPMAYIDI